MRIERRLRLARLGVDEAPVDEELVADRGLQAGGPLDIEEVHGKAPPGPVDGTGREKRFDADGGPSLEVQNWTGISGLSPFSISYTRLGDPFSQTRSIERLGLKPWWRQ